HQRPAFLRSRAAPTVAAHRGGCADHGAGAAARPPPRCLKTIAGIVLGCRAHASTISRRLRNVFWRTHDWYVDLYDRFVTETSTWERQPPRQRNGGLRRWMAIIDTTYH